MTNSNAQGRSPDLMADQSHTPSTSLAGQLMATLQQHRVQCTSKDATARAFLSAIELAVGPCAQGWQSAAAAAYRIDPLLLDKLAALARPVPCQTAQGRYTPLLDLAEQRWLSNLFPELVRQVALVESGRAVDRLSDH